MKALIAPAIATIAAVIIAAPPSTSTAPHQALDESRIEEVEKPGLHVDSIPEPGVAPWARERFVEAGLTLPLFNIEAAGGVDDCGGNTAVAIHGTSTSRIILCTNSDASDVVLKRTVLHEMAHIWARAHVDGETRDAFIALRGVPSWDDESRWDLRGSEHAAEIITWALMDDELQLLTLADHDPASLTAGYELLTGMRPPTER